MILTETKFSFDEMPNFVRIGKILSSTEFLKNVMPQISLERVVSFLSEGG